MTTCPNCRDEADVVLEPGAGPEQEPDEYGRMCVIGTRHDEWGGYRFYHTQVS